jgi:glycosyltransferase involved in cell wall biosynthesis
MENRRIHLLFIVNSLTFGGAEKHAVALLNGLDAERFRLSLAYLKHDETLLPQVDAARLEGGVACCHVSRRIDLHAVGLLAARLRDEAVDIVVCVNTYSLLYGWLARLHSGLHPRMVEIFHTTETGSLRGELEMLFYRPLFLPSHALVYVCDSQRAYWRAKVLRARRDVVIHNGVDTEHFRDRYTPAEKHFWRKCHGFSADDFVVGLCAAMRPEKAHDDLLRAIAGLRAAGCEAKCLLIGDGPQRPSIDRRIDAMGLADHVRITGFVRDVRPLIAACDAMTIVSHHVETFSIAALEAMALGKPMVMTRIGGAAEQIVHGANGYLYPRGDIAALIRALRRLREGQRCRVMGARARATVAGRFSIEAMIAAYADLFAGLASAPAMRERKLDAA